MITLASLQQLEVSQLAEYINWMARAKQDASGGTIRDHIESIGHIAFAITAWHKAESFEDLEQYMNGNPISIVSSPEYQAICFALSLIEGYLAHNNLAVPENVRPI